MSFQLVDRIHELTPGRRATGALAIPPDVGEFPLCLVVEAVGQLAGYVAMASCDFAQRPVAAVAGEVVADAEIRPGDVLDLEIEVRALRSNAMRYDGLARVEGRPAVRLERCTGALLPMDLFDDPERVRAELAALRAGDAVRRSFPSRADFAPRVETSPPDEEGRRRASLYAPEEAAFYADHFPRRPVYPATLLLDAKIEIARALVGAGSPAGVPLPRIRAVRDVKVRAFTPPGGRVDVVVEVLPGVENERGSHVAMEAFADGARVSAATVVLASA